MSLVDPVSMVMSGDANAVAAMRADPQLAPFLEMATFTTVTGPCVYRAAA